MNNPPRIATAIVDDEPLARSGLRKLLEKDPELELVAEAGNGRAALAALAERPVDLLFLDVQMPGMSGLQVLDRIPAERRPVIVFITAHDEYAVKAFELHAVDYLLKPFSNGRFFEAVRRAKVDCRSRANGDVDARLRQMAEYFQKNLTAVTTTERSGLPERIVVKADGDLHFIDHADVVWIEGQGDYLRIHAGRQTVLIRETAAAMEKKLDPRRFLRVHKSAIVNLDRVRKLKPVHYGDRALEMDDGAAVRIGRAYRDRLAAALHTADE